MSKRTIAILLIVFGLIAIIAALYWTFSPAIKTRSILPSMPKPSAPIPQPTPSVIIPPAPPKPTAPRTSVNEEQAELVLRQQAMAFVARQGTYTNADGFVALRDVYLDVTPTVRAFYESEQQRLSKEHPLMGDAWLQTTRALSAKITSDLPLIGKTQAVVTVQAQQSIETGQKPVGISYREILVTFTYTQGRWVVSRVESKVLAL